MSVTKYEYDRIKDMIAEELYGIAVIPNLDVGYIVERIMKRITNDGGLLEVKEKTK